MTSKGVYTCTHGYYFKSNLLRRHIASIRALFLLAQIFALEENFAKIKDLAT